MRCGFRPARRRGDLSALAIRPAERSWLLEAAPPDPGAISRYRFRAPRELRRRLPQGSCGGGAARLQRVDAACVRLRDRVSKSPPLAFARTLPGRPKTP